MLIAVAAVLGLLSGTEAASRPAGPEFYPRWFVSLLGALGTEVQEFLPNVW